MQLEASAKEKETRRHLQQDGSLAMVASANVARWRVIGFALAGACPMPGPTARAGALPLGECGELQGPRPLVPPLLARVEGARAAIATDSEPGPPRRRRPAGTARASRAPQKGTVLSCQRARARKAAQAAEFLEQHGPGRPRAIGPSRSFRLVWSPSSRLSRSDRSRGTNLTLNQRAQSATTGSAGRLHDAAHSARKSRFGLDTQPWGDLNVQSQS